MIIQRKMLCDMQITASSVRLISSQTSKLCAEWKPPGDRNISVANCNSSHVVCAVGRDLYYIVIQSDSLESVGLVLLCSSQLLENDLFFDSDVNGFLFCV